MILLWSGYAGGKGSGFGTHSLGEESPLCWSPVFGPSNSPGLAWETESLASTMFTSLLQANSNKSKLEVKMG